METSSIVIYSLLAAWAVFSIFYMIKVWSSGIDKIILPVYHTIPNVFTTLGVLGTFLGIYFGLREFNVSTITDSIPLLLESLKTAFTTSIWGIGLSLIFAQLTQIVLNTALRKLPPKSTDELTALDLINKNIIESNKSLQTLNTSLVGESSDNLSGGIQKMNDQMLRLTNIAVQQEESLLKVHNSIGNSEGTSLIKEVLETRIEQNEIARNNSAKVDLIVGSIDDNNQLIATKFDEFSTLLAKNNTDMLVQVMKQATEEFNTQMSSLVEKLVQENFQELNDSVQKMNNWQKEHRIMVAHLTNQFTQVVENFQTASDSIKVITANTDKLTNNNGHLSKLVQELQKVMIDDTKYQNIITQLTSTVDTIKKNAEAFDHTTDKLNNWVRHQMDFSDSVAKLLTRLEDIDRIKDINEVFWNGTKKQLNEGISLIEKANKRLSDDVESINEEFYDRLNNTLQNLDRLIQRMILNYRESNPTNLRKETSELPF